MDKSVYDFRIRRAEIDKEDIKYLKQWNHCRPVLLTVFCDKKVSLWLVMEHSQSRSPRITSVCTHTHSHKLNKPLVVESKYWILLIPMSAILYDSELVPTTTASHSNYFSLRYILVLSSHVLLHLPCSYYSTKFPYAILIKRNTDSLLNATKEVSLKVKVEKTTQAYIFISRHQTAE
jgi:hypothetical protein